MRYPKDRLAALASASALRAIREGLLWTMPCLLVSALFLVLSVVAGQAGLPAGVVESLAAVHARLNAIMPLLVGTSVGYMLSIRHRVPNLPAAFLCLSYVVIAEALLAPHPHAPATLILSLAILLPLGCVPLLAWLHRRHWTRLAPDGLIGENVRGTLNMVIPGVLTAAAVALAISALLRIPGVARFDIPVDLASLESPFTIGPAIAAALPGSSSSSESGLRRAQVRSARRHCSQRHSPPSRSSTTSGASARASTRWAGCGSSSTGTRAPETCSSGRSRRSSRSETTSASRSPRATWRWRGSRMVTWLQLGR